MPYHHIKLFIDDYLAGNLSTEDKARFEEILAFDEESRRFFEEEKRLLYFLNNSGILKTGEQYWDRLENSILSRIDADAAAAQADPVAPPAGKSGLIFGQLFPLAASLIVFIASLAITGGTSYLTERSDAGGPQLFQEIGLNDEGSGQPPREGTPLPAALVWDEGMELAASVEFVIFSSIMTSPPGSFGRQLMTISNLHSSR
ncbi:MAG: hypothetical protein JSV44_01090 [Candidatus Zixiibacteriota bacterium]|nr:MAG: hypothetical protein JSV44_01090 [candidate division Zixibacteria bacterium]